jgi:hypothetical protein
MDVSAATRRTDFTTNLHGFSFFRVVTERNLPFLRGRRQIRKFGKFPAVRSHLSPEINKQKLYRAEPEIVR